MSPKRIGPVAQAWYKWKALRLPWRNRFLIGYDLEGYTYWEFRLSRDDQRLRRIVHYPRSTYLSQVKVSPLWHQWLRHTRQEPPSLEEQQTEVVRQARMKYLAAEADARWEAKPKVMEDPYGSTNTAQPQAALGLGQDVEHSVAQSQTKAAKTEKAAGEQDAAPRSADPWARAKAQAPGESWQPQAWTPGGNTRKG